MYLISRGSGRPVLFLHGIPTSCHLWSPVIERMLGQFTCIAVDLPGLGRSAMTQGGLRDLNKMATEIERIRIRLKIEEWHLVGHDAGCAVAVYYAHRFPNRVARLALLSPSIFPDLKPFHLFEILRRPVIGELMAPIISLLFWSIAMRLACDANNARREQLIDFRAPFRGLRGAWRLMALLRWGDPAAVLALVPAMLPQLLAPTLIFHGSKDPAVPPDFARRAAGLIPNARVILLESGHFLPMNEPEIIAKELHRFLARGQQDDPESEFAAIAVGA